MCLTPITIKNPYLGLGHLGVNFLHDCTSTTIQVPCGNCPSCIALKQMFILQRVQMESLRSHLFMFTLTYNDKSLMFAHCGEYHIPVPLYTDIRRMFKRIYNSGIRVRYFVCSEYGKLHFRPHFHGILAVEKTDEDVRLVEKRFSRLIRKEWRRNYGSKRKPIYRSLSTDVFKGGRNTTYDFHYIEPIRGHDNDVSYYVSKYVTKLDKRTDKLLAKIKLDDSLTDDEMDFLYKAVKPMRLMSKDFGDWKFPAIKSKITSMSSRKTDYLYPQFFDIYTGQQMPMSPYYGKRLPGFAKAYERYEKYSDFADDNTFIHLDDSSLQDIRASRPADLAKIVDFEKKMRKVFARCEI